MDPEKHVYLKTPHVPRDTCVPQDPTWTLRYMCTSKPHMDPEVHVYPKTHIDPEIHVYLKTPYGPLDTCIPQDPT